MEATLSDYERALDIAVAGYKAALRDWHNLWGHASEQTAWRRVCEWQDKLTQVINEREAALHGHN